MGAAAEVEAVLVDGRARLPNSKRLCGNKHTSGGQHEIDNNAITLRPAEADTYLRQRHQERQQPGRARRRGARRRTSSCNKQAERIKGRPPIKMGYDVLVGLNSEGCIARLIRYLTGSLEPHTHVMSLKHRRTKGARDVKQA